MKYYKILGLFCLLMAHSVPAVAEAEAKTSAALHAETLSWQEVVGGVVKF